MFGFPSGDVCLNYTNGKHENIMMTDTAKPRQLIMESEHVLDWVKIRGYKNIESISYESNGRKTIVPMADYYYEHAKELKQE